ncbi:MAG: ATP-grasp domain-containing protein, partial [Spirochaetales bacterium]
MHKKSLMILGAGLLQLPAIRTAKDLGCKTLVVDGNPSALGRAEADVFEAVDLKDLNGLMECAGKWQTQYGLDGVFTAGTDFSTSVAYLAEQFHLPGIPFQTALNATNKARMRTRFKESGVPSPAFLEVGLEQVSRLKDWIPAFPLVLKPVDNMGARGVVRVDSMKELERRILESFQYSRSGKVIVEEFIAGQEFSLDALIYKGEIQICGVADRHIRFSPNFVEVGHTIPTQAPLEIQREVEGVFIKGIRALGIHTGAAKGDIFYSPQTGGVVGEIAARLSGGYMSGWTYPYSSGVNLTEGAIKIALGEPPGDRTPHLSYTAAERALISIPGRVIAIEGVEEASRTPNVRDIFLRVRQGDRVVFPTNNVEKCGNIIAAAPTRAQAVQAAEEAVSKIAILLDPLDDATEAFLFTSEWKDERSCFPLDTELMNRLRTRPWQVNSLSDSLKERLFPDFPLPILLPPSLEKRTSWNYDSVPHLLERLRFYTSRWQGSPWIGRWVPGALFWYVLLRGGLQGVVWMFDRVTLCTSLEQVKEFQ